MAIGHQPQFRPYYDDPHEQTGDPMSSPAAFIAALALLAAMFLVVVLLWAPWSSAGDNGGSNPALSQPLPAPAGNRVQPDGIQIVPQDSGSTTGR